MGRSRDSVGLPCKRGQAADQGRVEASRDGDAVPAQGLGLLIGDAIAVDRRGQSGVPRQSSSRKAGCWSLGTSSRL